MKYRLLVGAHGCHQCQLNVDWAVKTATTQTKPAYRACAARSAPRGLKES